MGFEPHPVCAGQYFLIRNQTCMLLIQYQAPITGLLERTSSACSTAVLSVIGRLKVIMIGMPTP
jgi:hypothetical protein